MAIRRPATEVLRNSFHRQPLGGNPVFVIGHQLLVTGHKKKAPKGAFFHLPILLLVTVLTKPLLAFVRGHFMALTLLSAWHGDPWLT